MKNKIKGGEEVRKAGRKEREGTDSLMSYFRFSNKCQISNIMRKLYKMSLEFLMIQIIGSIGLVFLVYISLIFHTTFLSKQR